LGVGVLFFQNNGSDKHVESDGDVFGTIFYPFDKGKMVKFFGESTY